MPEIKKTKESPLDSEHQNDVPEYTAVTVQLKNVTEIYGSNIDRFSTTMPSIGKIDVQKDWVFIWPGPHAQNAVPGYVKIPMYAVRAIKYQAKVKTDG